MAQTANLNLPLIDETMTADVPRDMNALAQAVDSSVTEALADITVPDATTTTKGIVQLDDSVTSTSTTRAATPNAVKKAYDQATTANTTANAANLAATSADGKVDTHAALTTAHGAVSTATANRMILRDSAGRAKVAAPAAADDIARKDTVFNAVGSLSTLKTTAKTNAVAAINELFQSASDGKTAVAAAITGKGVAASGSDTFAVLAQKIGQIDTGVKFASGTGTTSGTTNNNKAVVSGLSFTPNIIIIEISTGGLTANKIYTGGVLDAYTYTNSGVTYRSGWTITSNGFSTDITDPGVIVSYSYKAFRI